MKRVLFFLVIITVLSISATYIFVPATLKVSVLNIVHVNAEAAFRIVSKPENWKSWTAVNNANPTFPTAQSFIYNNDTFAITDVLHNILKIRISDKNLSATSLFSIVPVTKDSIVIRWESEVPTGTNPVSKIWHYRQTIKLKNNMVGIMNNLQQYLSKQKNVYTFKFHIATTTDTSLVSIKTLMPAYPTVTEIYSSIKKLQLFINKNGVKQTAEPMMNITKLTPQNYQLMVALPIDKAVDSETPFLYKKLIYGNFLITEVTGGNNKINHALEMMQMYINDMGKTSMAIPFQVLITDRKQQPDSTKWITKIYFPIVR